MIRRNWNGPIEKLSHCLAADRRVWVFCLHCGNAHRAHPFDLAKKAGADVTLEELRPRMRCDRCKQRGRAILVPEDRPSLARNQ